MGLNNERIQKKSILELFFNPILWLELIVIFIPVFIKSQRKKEGQELILETKIVHSVRMCWILFGLIILLPFVFLLIESKMN